MRTTSSRARRSTRWPGWVCWGCSSPDSLGGSQLSRLTGALVYEQLGMADMGVAVSLSVHNMVAGLIYTFGSDEQRKRWIPEMATGKQIGAFALSEAHAGSDAANIQCSARREGDAFVVNGSKFWVTDAGVADLYLVFVRTSPNTRSRGVSALVVEKGTRRASPSARWSVRWGCTPAQRGS